MIESFEYVAPVYTETFSAATPQVTLVPDKAGKQKSTGLFGKLFSRGDDD